MTRAFYDLFYHVDLSDAELDTLIAWSNGQRPTSRDAGWYRRRG